MFNTIDEVYDYLYNQKKLSKRVNLERIKRAYTDLNIKINYKIIHIAGTNGKGSTAFYIKNILSSINKRVGLFVSPFILRFNERIQVNDRFISDSEIIHYSNILYTYNEDYKVKYNDVIPFFELTLLMALMYYQDRGIDVAVIECGLGGLLDSTNFLDTDISIITNVGYDHMAQLGSTLDEIADHKLGIARVGHPLITAVSNELKDKFINYSKDNNINLIRVNDDVTDIYLDSYTHFKYKNIEYKTSLLGLYQAYNASIAIEAAKLYDSKISDELINYALSDYKWPGRFEIVSKNPIIILDGAHNISAIEALEDSIKKLYPNKKINIIFTALVDKEYGKMINSLDNIANKYYFTNINDLRASNIDDFKNFTNKEYKMISNMDDAIDQAIKEIKEDELILITGSLHFISMARKYILK